jgi:hypothetical protein
VDRGVGKAPPAPNPVGLQASKGFEHGVTGMRVEIIQDQLDALRGGIEHIRQVAHGMGKIGFGAALGEEHMALAGQRLDQHEQAARAAPSVCVILATGMLGTQGQPGTTGGQQWLAFLIEAHDRIQRVGGAGVRRQHMLHLAQELRGDLGNTPPLDRPRLQGVF